jgi:hypothetical protein
MLTAFDDWDHAASRDAHNFDALWGRSELKVLDDADKNSLHFENSEGDSSAIEANNWIDRTHAKRQL